VIILFLIGAVIVTLAHTAPFPFVLEAFKPERSIWRVPPTSTRPRALYLTFDDGPHLRWTPMVLDALAEVGARATFFLIDEHVGGNTAPLVGRIAAEGHSIALHSGTRRLMLEYPDDLVVRLDRAASRIQQITGHAPCPLFRPHAGWRSGAMYAGLEKAGYQLAGWTFGMWDFDWWRRPEATRIADRLARKAAPGDIIVIHDGHHANAEADRRHAGETIRLLVPRLRSRGFTFDRLCDPRVDGRQAEPRAWVRMAPRSLWQEG
jgi:peptidoglycan/xylan/chitin deacetylase (PgdA/CDA1 family)